MDMKCIFQTTVHECNDPGILSKSQVKTKQHMLGLRHYFPLGKTHWVPTRSLPRSHTSLPRCGPDGHIQKQSRENLGFPSKNMNMKNIKNMHAQITACYSKNLRFHAMSSKTWTWVPIQEDHMKTNTKTWFLLQTFGSKQDFLSRIHEHYSLLLKLTLNQCMACRTDSIVQCSWMINKNNKSRLRF